MKLLTSTSFQKMRLKGMMFLSIATIFLGGSFLATEITAYQFDFQKALGDAWFANTFKPGGLMLGSGFILVYLLFYLLKRKINFAILFGLIGGFFILSSIPLYNLFNFFTWWTTFGDLIATQGYWYTGWVIVGLFSFMALMILLRFKYKYFAEKPIIDTHGSAHFAMPKEVEQTELLLVTNPLSRYVGAWQCPHTKTTHYLRFSGTEHVFVYAPSRSGKGICLVVPTLLSYAGSLIISDFKGENWQLTAGFRKRMGHHVIKFDPTAWDSSSACYNPLLEVRRGFNEIRDIQNIVAVIADPFGTGKFDHWSESASDLCVCLILHVLYVEKDKSLAGVRNVLSNPYQSYEETFERLLKTIHDPNHQYGWIDDVTGKPTQTHPIVASGCKDMLNKSEEERSGVISTLKRFLKLYRDPVIAKNTRTSDFSINDLVGHEKPTSLYLVIPPGDIERTMPLMRIVLHQTLSRLTETLEVASPTQQSKYPLTLMLDEFPQFGRLEFFEKSLAYLSGFNISCYFITQDLAQIYQAYGQHQSILSNCRVRVAFTPNTAETAKHISELLGTTTIVKEHTHFSGERINVWLKHKNVGNHETRRELMTPDELLRLPKEDALIFTTGNPPIYGKKIPYYIDPIFKERSQIPAPLTSRFEVKTDWNDAVSALLSQEISLKPNSKSILPSEHCLEEDDLGNLLLPIEATSPSKVEAESLI